MGSRCVCVCARTRTLVCIVRGTGVSGRFTQQRDKEWILFPQDMIRMFVPQRKKIESAENVLYYLPLCLSLLPYCWPVYTFLYCLQVHLQSFLLKMYPSIHLLIHTLGRRGLLANPAVKGGGVRAPPWRGRQPIAGLTHQDRQSLTRIWTPNLPHHHAAYFFFLF